MSTTKAKYVGEAEGDIQAFGLTFPEGKAVEIDAKTAAKLDGNPFFEVDGFKAETEPKGSDELVKALKVETDKVADLTSKLEAANAEIEALKKPAPDTGLKAEHHGGSKFKITRGEEVVAEGLSKADADAFNALSDTEKAEYVKAKV